MNSHNTHSTYFKNTNIPINWYEGNSHEMGIQDKNNNRHIERLVVMGFRQVEEIDFNESNSPVMMDVEFFIMVTLA